MPSEESKYPTLDTYSTDFISIAKDGKFDPVIGRDAEIRRIIQILARRTKNNPILLAEGGVGKTCLVQGLAMRIAQGDVPNNFPKRLLSLSICDLVAGCSFVGEFEKRMSALLKEIKASESASEPIILFIDEIHQLFGAGAGGNKPMDAANILKPMLARGEIRCIGATTDLEYRLHFEKDPAFERRFCPVHINEPDVESTITILRGSKKAYENHHGVQITDGAIVACVKLSARYIPSRFFPDKAIDVLDEACASVRVQLDSHPEALDVLERKEMNLLVEQKAIENETDFRYQKRKLDLVSELLAVQKELNPLKSKYENEKRIINEHRDLNTKLEQIKQKLNNAETQKDAALVADLKFGAILDLQEKLKIVNAEMDTLRNNRLLSNIVNESKVAEIVSKSTSIPMEKLNESSQETLLKLEERLHQKVVGQNKAVEVVSKCIRRSRLGLSDQHRPTGCFMFLGPSGCGKTCLAKALAADLFHSDKYLIRLDMSEFMEEHSISRLIGTTAGFIGFENGGQLTEAVRKHPYSVILFDEIEKAHPKVHNLFLQLLDEGRLTDGHGRLVNFTNCIIIFTSNIGSKHLANIQSFVENEVMKELKIHFRPEFLNRLDDVVFFSPLQKQEFDAIFNIQLLEINKKLIDEHQLELVCTDNTREAAINLATKQSEYGARPLKRFLEKEFIDNVANLILTKKIKRLSKDNNHVDVSPHPHLPEKVLVEYHNSCFSYSQISENFQMND